MAGILAYVVKRFGEAELETCYRAIMEPYLQERYMAVRRPPDALRGHPRPQPVHQPRGDARPPRRPRAARRYRARRGGRSLDHPLRPVRVGRPDPAGRPGGGHADRACWRRTSSASSRKPRPWTWGETGVCHYCAHCNLALSTIPAERWGHPVRTVDPPLWRGEDDPATNRKCQWTVWKSLEAIPEREYERIGRTKPPLPVIQPGAAGPSTGATDA